MNDTDHQVSRPGESFSSRRLITCSTDSSLACTLIQRRVKPRLSDAKLAIEALDSPQGLPMRQFRRMLVVCQECHSFVPNFRSAKEEHECYKETNLSGSFSLDFTPHKGLSQHQLGRDFVICTDCRYIVSKFWSLFHLCADERCPQLYSVLSL